MIRPRLMRMYLILTRRRFDRYLLDYKYSKISANLNLKRASRLYSDNDLRRRLMAFLMFSPSILRTIFNKKNKKRIKNRSNVLVQK